MGHLFLQLVNFTGHDCLSSGSLLGDLLHDGLLDSLPGSFFALLPSEVAAAMHCLLPGVEHLPIAR